MRGIERGAVPLLAIGGLILIGSSIRAQEPEIERPAPPPLETFETDVDGDGVPDGWYNLRDATMAPGGVITKPRSKGGCLRFEDSRPGRPARASRAFGVDGRTTEAVVIGIWIRQVALQAGERMGEDAGLIIDFLDEGLKTTGRGTLGPWTSSLGPRWMRMARRIPVPSNTRDAILTVGLLGGTGILEVDGLTIELIPVGGTDSTNLILNGNFEMGDPGPTHWSTDGGVRRAVPGFRSASALELSRAGSWASTPLGIPVDRLRGLQVTVMVRASALRVAGGAGASIFFLDAKGRVLPGLETGVTAFRWGGSFEWRPDQVQLAVPPGAVVGLFQIEKFEPNGTLRIDDVQIRSSPAPDAGAWTPYHVEEETAGWRPFEAADAIGAESALDASNLLEAPAGSRGFVKVRDGRLAFEKGGRARFFGVVLLPPTAFMEPKRSEALADRLARSGVNLVRLTDFDAPIGPGQSLFDDARDDTKAFDPVGLSRFDHLIAALKARGIYISLEFQGIRRFRGGDDVPDVRGLPPGGGPAAAFDPKIRARAVEASEALLAHVNPETGLALRDDPVLAWVVLAGELSLFDLPENPMALPPTLAEELQALGKKSPLGTGRRFWEATESAQWKAEAEALRHSGLQVPLAGDSHWRRDPEFNAAQTGDGLDLIDDRLYWLPPRQGEPSRLSMLWGGDGALVEEASKKRKADRPYAVGQWCAHTGGASSLPYEGADLLLMAQTARVEDWDALIRRGVFLHPETWGLAVAGTGGGPDIFRLPEVINGIPPVFALLPHAASIYLREPSTDEKARPAPRRGRARGPSVPGWEAAGGRLVIDTPHTQGIAGWSGGRALPLSSLTIESKDSYAVVIASSLGPEPIARSSRLLVTAVARVEPTGVRWVDSWRGEVDSPGTSPLLVEPVRARVFWKRQGKITAYPLDNSGKRGDAVDLETTKDGAWLTIDGSATGLHWELVIE